MIKFFGYFQFSFLVIFAAVVIVKSYQLLRKKIKPLTLWKSGLIYGVAETIYLVLTALWLFEFVIYSLNIKSLLYPAFFHIELFSIVPTKIVGCIFLIIGLILFTLAQISFGDSWRVGIDSSDPGKLVTNGIFSISRNPIYVAIALIFIGSFLINSKVIFLIACIFMLPTLHIQAVKEERFLLGLYGQKYRDYCSKVGRYITWRRR